MIISVKAKETFEEEREEELYKNLIEDFNKISKELKSKYYLSMDCNYPTLIKPLFLNFGQSLGDNTIYYNKEEDCFYFEGGIEDETFQGIKSILEKLNQKFMIEVL